MGIPGPVQLPVLHAANTSGIRHRTGNMASSRVGGSLFRLFEVLRLLGVSGGLGHRGRQHVANEYMTVWELKDFEKFPATFLYLTAKTHTQQ